VDNSQLFCDTAVQKWDTFAIRRIEAGVDNSALFSDTGVIEWDCFILKLSEHTPGSYPHSTQALYRE